jgi:hypothetical protein
MSNFKKIAKTKEKSSVLKRGAGRTKYVSSIARVVQWPAKRCFGPISHSFANRMNNICGSRRMERKNRSRIRIRYRRLMEPLSMCSLPQNLANLTE